MGDKTGIEWTDATWNPVTGCDRVSPGCDNCYALTLAARLKAMGSANYQTDGHPRTSGPGFGVQCHPHMLDQPLRWRRPRRIFVNSMSDLFHPDVPDEFIAQVFAVMAVASQHTFQVLTKRPQRMAALLQERSEFTTMVHDALEEDLGHREACYDAWPLPNVWIGTSIESDRYSWRADHLRATPAAVRFISAEPLLGPLVSIDLAGIDWLIVGGESGPGARPMQPEWVRDLRDGCLAQAATGLVHGAGKTAGAVFGPRPAFHFKQWGEWVPYEPDPQPPFWNSQHGHTIDGHHFPDFNEDPPGWTTSNELLTGPTVWRRVGKHHAGRMLDGRTWDEYP
jgi:protein gp37